MANKSKKEDDRSLAVVNLGKKRKRRIAAYRYKKASLDLAIANVPEAVNLLVDRALEAEGIA